MKSKTIKQYILYLSILTISVLLLVSITKNEPLLNKQNLTEQKLANYTPKSSVIITGPIIIDDLGNGDFTWTEASLQSWCSGSGTYNSPYIIEEIQINGGGTSACIIVRDSNVNFIIQNSVFENYGTRNGIQLHNADNGRLIDNNCTSNIGNGNGIFLYSSDNNTISGNIANGNRAGIHLSQSSYNTISGNTINNNAENGIHLDYSSNNNFVFENILIGNELFILEESCEENLFIMNFYNGDFFTDSIVIDDAGFGDLTWTEATLLPFCSGSGTWSDPYIIENIHFQSLNLKTCLTIRDSNAFFIIRNCIFEHYGLENGLRLSDADNGNLIDNDCSYNNGNGIGIFLYSSENHTISGNTLSENKEGIYLSSSSYNTLSGNNINDNTENGILLDYNSDNNLVINNTLIGNTLFIREDACEDNLFIMNYYNGNFFTDSIVIDDMGFGDLTWAEAAQLSLCVGSGTWSDPYNIDSLPFQSFSIETCLTIRDSNVFFIIQNCVFENYGWENGIHLYDADNGRLINNNCSSDYGDGYGLSFYHSNNHTISGNIVKGNRRGIYVSASSYNLISGNIIHNNAENGIKLDYSSNFNIIYNNNFVGNGIHAIEYLSNNEWDNGSLGNYWDNYTGLDLNDNGIGDTSYIIPGTGGSQDNFPIWDDGINLPIYINENSDFADLGFPGSGTAGDPYIIEEGRIIDSTSTLIHIQDTNVYFIIKNFYLDSLSSIFGSIFLLNVQHGTIVGNEIINTRNGIHLDKSSYNIIEDNTIESFMPSFWTYGIYLDESTNNTLSSNNVINGWVGYKLDYSSNNIVSGNTATESFYGLSLWTCFDNIFSDYSFIDCHTGFSTTGGGGNNIFLNNIALRNEIGFLLWGNQAETFLENEAIECMRGFYLYDASNYVLYNNIAMNSSKHGFSIINSDNNTFIGNKAFYGKYGFFLNQSSNNLIVESELIGNEINAYDNGVNNQWDDGEVGNYWDDYLGMDANDNGIGDTPYIINGSIGVQDNYPIWDDGPNTPIGEDVAHNDLNTGVSIIYSDVSLSGTTTITYSSILLPLPSGFSILGSHYEITTTAIYNGIIIIAIPYDESLVIGNEEALTLMHWEDALGRWVDVKTWVDTDNNIIYGEVTHFSIFAIMEQVGNFNVNSYLDDGDSNPISYFDLIFTKYKSDGYMLVATNPGQIFYNIEILCNQSILVETLLIDVTIPSDFILKGATPIHIYLDGIDITEMCTIEGTSIVIPNIPPNSKISIIIHLDYALKGNLYETVDSFGMVGYNFEVEVQGTGGVQKSSARLTTHQKKTTAISGFVTDVNGNPLANITVVLYKYDSDGQLTLMGTTKTDENGFYYFIDIDAGEFKIQISEDLYEFATVLKNTLTQIDFRLIS